MSQDEGNRRDFDPYRTARAVPLLIACGASSSHCNSWRAKNLSFKWWIPHSGGDRLGIIHRWHRCHPPGWSLVASLSDPMGRALGIFWKSTIPH